ncbi:MAG: MFS transporter [Alphaproteobacteria bacterium]|nr:MFS transporter [Alphaproteobacteria bacterium]
MQPSTRAGGGAWTIFAVLCLAYTLSQFYRAANAVIGPDITRELQFGPVELSIITSSFFIAFGLVQPFVGVLLDRYGPRFSMTALMVVAVAGAILFAVSSSLEGLSFARILLGIGNSALLIGPLVVYARWFPPQRFGLLTSVHIAVGSLGTLLATSPLAEASATFGWRGAFLGMTAITALFAVLILVVVRDGPSGHPFLTREPERLIDSFRGIREVLRNRRMWLIFAMNFTAYPSTITVLGLWGGPYLADVHGLDTAARGQVLQNMAIASIIGYLAFGPLDRVLDTRKWLVIGGACGIVAVLCLLAFVPGLALWQVSALLAAHGFLASSFAFVLAHGRSVFEERLVGRGMTVLNFGTMMGSFTLQYLTGLVIGAFGTADGAVPPESAYRAMFGTLALCLALAVLVYWRIEDAKPSEEARRATQAR